MGLLEDFKSGSFQKYNLILIGILFIFVFYQYWDKNIEKMADDEIDIGQEIVKSINKYYGSEIEPIRNLAQIATQLNNSKGITIPSNLVVTGRVISRGSLTVGEKDKANGEINVYNNLGGLGVSIKSNDEKFGGSVFTYKKDNPEGQTSYGNYFSYSSTNIIAPGMVVAWSGSKIPDGWALCDGKNGTPNLIDRFIRGSKLEEINKFGGSDEVTLSIENLPPHSHTYSKTLDDFNWGGPDNRAKWQGEGYPKKEEAETEKTGGGKAFSILPPFYTLAYIIKL